MMKREGKSGADFTRFGDSFESSMSAGEKSLENRAADSQQNAASRFEITAHEASGIEASAIEYSLYENEKSSWSRSASRGKIFKGGALALLLSCALFGSMNFLKSGTALLNTNLHALNLQAHLLLKDFPEAHSKYTELTGNPLATATQETKLTTEKVAFVARMAGFPEEAAETMTCIAFAESSHRHAAKNRNRNGTHDTGLFQINDVWLKRCKVTRTELLDPLTNAKCAYEVWKVSGFSAWEGYKRNRKKCDDYSLSGQEIAAN